MATYTFEPPVAKIVPRYLADTRGLQYLLFRYYQPEYKGVNVYALSDGTFAQDYPTPENQNTNFPLPFNPTEPNAPYAQWTNIDGTLSFKTLPVRIEKIYLGGHIYTITAGEAEKLSAAGYEDRITVTP
jgi:hypothetical protein